MAHRSSLRDYCIVLRWILFGLCSFSLKNESEKPRFPRLFKTFEVISHAYFATFLPIIIAIEFSEFGKL